MTRTGADKVRVAVLMGGPSVEHEVSLHSGARVVAALDRSLYEVLPVRVDRQGRYRICASPVPDGTFDADVAFDSLPDMAAGLAVTELLFRAVDVAFIAIHGTYGEDGTVQGLLSAAGLPFTGPGVVASALAIDKIATKAILRYVGIPVADDLVVTGPDEPLDDACLDRVEARLGLPCVVKAPCLGSSHGVAIANTRAELARALAACGGLQGRVLVERFLPGRELTCGVLEDAEGRLHALPVTEIRPRSAAWFDYHAKYTPGATEEITPAPIPDDVTRRVQDVTVRACRAVDIRGLSRVDLFLVGDDLFVLEINTIPGLTDTSLLPQQARAVGISFTDLLTRITQAALRRRP